MQYQAGPPKEAPKKTFVRDIRDDDTKKYRLGKELGSGSYGDVFEAEKKVACKVQHVDSDYRMWAIQRELNVWQTACKGSKFVAQVFDASFSHADGAIRIYTELLAGGDTLALIRSLDKADLLHPVIVLGLSLHLAQGLSEMQARNILHRDIKTDNSLLTMKITPQMNKALWELTKTGTVSERLYHPLVEFWDQFSTNDRLAVWTDFGVSRVETDMKERSTYSMVPDARWTPGTSAPELFFNNHQSLQADIYSFGKFPRIHSVYSSKLQELVDWCMQFELEDRPAAGEIIVELSKLWTAKNNEVKAVFNAHKDFRDRVAWQQSFLRQEALQRRVAAEAMARDQAAAKERERALEAWNELQREQKRIEAQQQQSGNSRRGQFTKEDRAKHL
ncbi:kinase-like domain-containing protein, partial [Dichotomopilus funicola]